MKMPIGNFWMATSAVGAALLFFTISLRVSTERSGVERLQQQVVADMRDVRALEAELSTRARKPVLQRWNDNVLGLGAPLPRQFATDAYELAAYAPGAAVPAMTGAPAGPDAPAGPVVQQAVARHDSPIAPVAQQRTGLQTVAYLLPEAIKPAAPAGPAAKPVPDKATSPAARPLDPLAGLLDGINTASTGRGITAKAAIK